MRQVGFLSDIPCTEDHMGRKTIPPSTLALGIPKFYDYSP